MFIDFLSATQVADQLRDNDPIGEPGTGFWLLSVSDSHADDIPALVAACRDRGITVHGAIFPGLIYDNKLKNDGVIAIRYDNQAQFFIASLSDEGAEWHPPLPTIPQGETYSSLMYVDCLAPRVTPLMETLYDRYGNSLIHYGAGSGFHDLRRTAGSKMQPC